MEGQNRTVNDARVYLQKETIESVEAAIIVNKSKMILAMATGNGKTFTAAELIYRFLKSKAAKRILFLVDRRALAGLLDF